MKQNTLTGIALTLMMLLLVAVAAFIFLYQGRQSLADDLATQTAAQSQQLLQTGSNLAAAEATRDVTLTVLATREADNVLLEGELVASQQQVDELTNELATQTAVTESTSTALTEIPTTTNTIEEAPPVARISVPTNGAAFAPGEMVTIVVAASDPKGLSAVNLTINEDLLESYDIVGDILFAAQAEWTAEEEGDYVIGLIAINVNGRANDPITITIHIEDTQAALAELRDQIEVNVIEIRGLEPLSPIEPTLLTTAELRQRIEEDFAEETTPEESREDAIVLSAFDFMSRDYDLYQALIDLQSEGVAGFYDPETAEFVVVSDDNELGADEQWTHAHEFMHALQDQYYPLGLISDDSLDSEAAFALRSLAEGEATLVQFLYLTEGYFTEAQQTELFASFDEEEPAIYGELPPVIFNSFVFPYNQGFEFVLHLYSGGDLFAPGDFAALEAVWNNLPQSSEQIIHPDRYLAGDMPLAVSLPPLTATLGAGWQQLDEDIMGEFFIRQYLGQQLSEAEVDTAATGWGGDRYVVFWNEAEQALVMALQIQWDSPADAAEFNALYPKYPAGLYGVSVTTLPDGTECWTGEDTICFYVNTIGSLIVRAPDVDTAVLVAETVISNQ